MSLIKLTTFILGSPYIFHHLLIPAVDLHLELCGQYVFEQLGQVIYLLKHYMLIFQLAQYLVVTVSDALLDTVKLSTTNWHNSQINCAKD